MASDLHEPLWLRRSLDYFWALFAQIYCIPHFAWAGKDWYILGPRYLDVSGPKISMGDHVHFMALRDKPIRLAVYEKLGSIHIGDYCIVNPGVRITSASEIRIGKGCMLAMNAYLSDADWHDLQHRIFSPGTSKPIILGDNVWIGDSALVCKGVSIGDNSVVGAYSVVTKDIPANTIVAGNPARVVGSINPDDVTTREHFFTQSTPYSDVKKAYYTGLYGDNRLLTWLRTKIYPKAKD